MVGSSLRDETRRRAVPATSWLANFHRRLATPDDLPATNVEEPLPPAFFLSPRVFCATLPAVTAEQIIGLAVALLLMGVGVLGSILPGLPSTPLVLLAAGLHKLYFGPAGAAWWVLLLLTALTAVSLIVDYVASAYGAKRLGATWRGAVGALVGGLFGLFLGLPGIVLGPFVGAALFEMAGGRQWRPAAKAGVGATLGLLAGAIGKVACCGLMVVLFAWNVVYRSLDSTPTPAPPVKEITAPVTS